jgi:intraflagellar transport protein 52
LYCRNKDDITKERLAEANVVVFAGSREPLTPVEVEEFKSYLNSGGRALITLGDGGDKGSGCNMNSLLEGFGITANNDSVMRSVFYKYLHPKEVFIAEGVLVPDVVRKKNNFSTGGMKKATSGPSNSRNNQLEKQLPFVYPYGSSINVQRPARPLLSSGPISFPINRPIAAIWESETVGDINNQRGRLVVLGSTEIFGDDWLDKEENSKLCDLLFSWLLSETELDMTSDRQDAELSELVPIPYLESLSQTLKPCIQGMDELPRDFTKMFDLSMFRFDVDLIPETIKLYDTLGVPHEPLTLIPPQFECPLPKMSPATFPPSIREPPPPALDQFDLDEHFAKETIRLAQLTNKCTNGEEDLEYYIAESGEILGVVQHLPFGERSAKHILYYIFKKIVDYKRQDGGKAVNEQESGNSKIAIATAEAYEYITGDDRPIAEATPMHIANVELAPMKGDAGRSHLQALDPNLQFGGRTIGSESKEKYDLGAKRESKNADVLAL